MNEKTPHTFVRCNIHGETERPRFSQLFPSRTRDAVTTNPQARFTAKQPHGAVCTLLLNELRVPFATRFFCSVQTRSVQTNGQGLGRFLKGNGKGKERHVCRATAKIIIRQPIMAKLAKRGYRLLSLSRPKNEIETTHACLSRCQQDDKDTTVSCTTGTCVSKGHSTDLSQLCNSFVYATPAECSILLLENAWKYEPSPKLLPRSA